MAKVKSQISSQIPSLQNWGGIRSIQKRLERSATIMENKEAVAYSLLCMANTKITDIMEDMKEFLYLILSLLKQTLYLL